MDRIILCHPLFCFILFQVAMILWVKLHIATTRHCTPPVTWPVIQLWWRLAVPMVISLKTQTVPHRLSNVCVQTLQDSQLSAVIVSVSKGVFPFGSTACMRPKIPLILRAPWGPLKDLLRTSRWSREKLVPCFFFFCNEIKNVGYLFNF